jgi:hypothetical protein
VLVALYRWAPQNFIPIIVLLLSIGPLLTGVPNVMFGGAISPEPSGCTAHYSFGSINAIPVLVLRSGSTGTICIEYRNTLSNAISTSPYISVYEYNSSGVYGVCSGCIFNLVSSSFQLNALPGNISFTRGADSNNQSETIIYSLTVPENLTNGIYGVYILGFCNLFPMEIVRGSLPLFLNASDFSSWYPHEGSCPAITMGTYVVGIGGFSEAFGVRDFMGY